MTQPILAGITLAYPQQYAEYSEPLATEYAGLNGVIVRDRRIGAPTVEFAIQMGWDEMTSAEVGALESAFYTLSTTATVSFTNPGGQTRTVWLPKGGSNLKVVTYTMAAGQTRFQATLTVRGRAS